VTHKRLSTDWEIKGSLDRSTIWNWPQ
jgi:hypothetical protein